MPILGEVDTDIGATMQKVLLEVRSHVAHITINRPEKLNAIDDDCLALLQEHVTTVNEDSSIRCLVIRGEGRAFCAGADLELVGSMVDDPAAFAAFLDRWHTAYDAVEACRVPTIAAIEDLALAGGFELMQVCDMVVLGDQARIGDNHAAYGLYPGGGSVQRLPRLIGDRRAKWLLLSGERISPEEALRSGLVNEVVPTDDVVPKAEALADTIASKSPTVSERIKWAMGTGSRTDVRTALRLERPTIVNSFSSDDTRKGLENFRKGHGPPEFFEDRRGGSSDTS